MKSVDWYVLNIFKLMCLLFLSLFLLIAINMPYFWFIALNGPWAKKPGNQIC